MRIKRLVIVVCIVIIALAMWNNHRYSRANQEAVRAEDEQDSIYLMHYENLSHSLNTSTQIIESYVQEHKSIDSAYLKSQVHLLQQMEILISIDQQILKLNQNQRCSISSTLHTAE